eukprot:9611555-Ditylum_brightwellii.AAC.1
MLCAISNESYINIGQGGGSIKGEHSPISIFKASKTEYTELQCNFSIFGLRKRQTDTVINAPITEPDDRSYNKYTIANHLNTQETEKKKKYHFLYQENRKNFPFCCIG